MQKFLINKIVLLIFFIFSFLFLILVSKASAANGSLYLSPSSGVYTVGNTFSVEVRVNTDGVPINAAQGTLVFSPDKLSVVSVSKSGSIFTLWTTEPTYSNSLGTIDFAGGLPNPGYTGASGKIITISFRARVNGIASVNWSSGAVLANDGKGTNILASMGGGTYTLGATTITPSPESPEISVPSGAPTEPEISSSTNPDENKWYNSSTVNFSWTLPKDVVGVSIMLNEKPISNPGPISDGLFDSKIYENAKDGIWYLHLKFKNNYGWGAIKHFKVQIDTTPPQPFSVKVEESDSPQPILLFEAKDEMSGIDHYKVKIDRNPQCLATIFEGCISGIIEEVSVASYKVPAIEPGKHLVTVEAIDKAGNSTATITEIGIPSTENPQITEYPQQISVEENLIIKGTSLPKAKIKVYIQKEGEKPIIGETQANETGEWVYIHDKFLSKGAYTVSVNQIDEKGVQSYLTKPITILVILPPFFKIGSIVIDYLTAIIVLIGLIALMVFGTYWSWHRFVLLRKRLIKETQDVDRVMRRAFDLLKEDVEEQLTKLNQAKSTRELNDKEKEIENQLKKDIDIAEKYIRKEVQDVEQRLKIKKKK